jgi:hypothetical protein
MTARSEAAGERTTAWHEAGHAVVAIDQRIQFTKVDIIVDETDHSRGRLCYAAEYQKVVRLLENDHHSHEDPRIASWIERRIVVGFAGGAAQRRYAPSSDWRNDAERDYRRNDAWLRQLLKGQPHYDDPWDDRPVPDGIEPFHDGDDEPWYQLPSSKIIDARRAVLEARAKDLVRKLFPEIKTVAAALLKHKTLTQAQVRKLMAGGLRARRSPTPRAAASAHQVGVSNYDDETKL